MVGPRIRAINSVDLYMRGILARDWDCTSIKVQEAGLKARSALAGHYSESERATRKPKME